MVSEVHEGLHRDPQEVKGSDSVKQTNKKSYSDHFLRIQSDLIGPASGDNEP